jgi:DNA (cytosine-5)-methyltransferase 1
VLENVAALLTRGLGRVLGTLAEVGYDAEWHCIPAAYVGAPHIRDRVFVMAYARCELGKSRAGKRSTSNAQAKRCSTSNDDQRCGEDVADSNSEGLEKWQGQNAIGTWKDRGTESFRSEWWAVEPDVGRVAHGIPARVDRLRGLGNAVVPQVAELVGRMVIDRLKRI